VEDEKELHTRVSVLEAKMDSVKGQVQDTKSLLEDFTGRLEYHIEEEGERDRKLHDTVIQNTSTLEYLSHTFEDASKAIKVAAEKAYAAETKIIKWETIVWTVAKVISILVFACGTAWTVYTYFDSKLDQQKSEQVR
jgi:uncharacterized protein YukE